MTKIIVNSINNHRERFFTILTIGILACSISYAYFLHAAISNVVEREDVVRETKLVSAKISELESTYFSLKNDIDLELAYSKGFSDSDVTAFISKNSQTALATPNEL